MHRFVKYNVSYRQSDKCRLLNLSKKNSLPIAASMRKYVIKPKLNKVQLLKYSLECPFRGIALKLTGSLSQFRAKSKLDTRNRGFNNPLELVWWMTGTSYACSRSAVPKLSFSRPCLTILAPDQINLFDPGLRAHPMTDGWSDHTLPYASKSRFSNNLTLQDTHFAIRFALLCPLLVIRHRWERTSVASKLEL